MPKHELELFDNIITITDHPEVKPWKNMAAVEIMNIDQHPIYEGHYFKLLTKEQLLEIADRIKKFAEQMH